jgi:putative membrane protein
VLTVPSDFSESILSLQTDNPRQADISIRTDDAHSYLTGSVAQVVGQTMTDTFGKQITAQYLGGIYSSLGDLGTSLTTAADGASSLASGAGSLTSGVQQYTDGVGSLSSGLDQLNAGAAGLSALSSGVSTYTSQVSQLSAGFSALNPALQASLPPELAAQVQQLVSGLAQASAGGAQLSQQTSGALSGIQSGIAQSAAGAGELAANGSALVSGAQGLTDGASQLASGLAQGAGQLPSGETDTAAAADVAADPVSLTVTTDNPVTDVGQAIATFFVPLGLWVGALAVFLVLKPVSRRALASTARNGRLVASAIARAGAVTAAQAVVLVALLHGALGVSWSLLPATLGFSLLAALAFTAFHYLLTIGFGRGGLIVSLFVLAIQVTSTGGIYPVQVLSTPFQAISPFLPLTWAVDGMQAIIAGGAASTVLAAAGVLALFGVVSVALALVAIRRVRRADALGIVPTPA